MKIYFPTSPAPLSRRRPTTTAGKSAAFATAVTDTAAETSAQTPHAVTGLDALIVLQGDGGSGGGNAAADAAQVTYGNTLLDELETLRMALVQGQISPQNMYRLQTLLAQKRPFASPHLQEVIDDIELRAAVELAKLEAL